MSTSIPVSATSLAAASSTVAVEAPPASAATTTSASTSTSTSAPATTGAPTSAPPDAEATLHEALAAVAPGYHFTTTITVGDTVALTAEGDRIDDRTRMAVTSNGATVSYLVTPDASWVEEAGTWHELDQAAPVTDPLGALGAPQEVSVAGVEGDRTVLAASYAASALGLDGDGAVDVTLDVVDGALAALGYAAPGSAPAAEVRTEISALADTSPITVPTV